MKFKTDKTQWIAWFGFMAEYTFAFAFSQYYTIPLVLLYFGLAGVFNFVLVHMWSEFAPTHHEKLLIVWPVVGMLAFADILFRFNTVFPFILLTVAALAGSVLFNAADNPEKSHIRLPAVLIVSVASVGGYLLITMPFGIFS